MSTTCGARGHGVATASAKGCHVAPAAPVSSVWGVRRTRAFHSRTWHGAGTAAPCTAQRRNGLVTNTCGLGRNVSAAAGARHTLQPPRKQSRQGPAGRHPWGTAEVEALEGAFLGVQLFQSSLVKTSKQASKQASKFQMPDALLAPAPDPLRRLRIRTRLRHGRARRLTAHRPRSAASRARALTRPAPPACTKMQKEMKETGKDVAAVHVSEDERDGDEAAAQQRAAAHARLLMQNQVQQQPEQQQFQPQMHMQLAGSGAMAASGEKRERGERGERGGVERAAGADGGCVERVSHCVASVHDVHDVSAGAVHAECAAASSVEGVRSDPVQHDKGLRVVW